jgi:hypothetical protein
LSLGSDRTIQYAAARRWLELTSDTEDDKIEQQNLAKSRENLRPLSGLRGGGGRAKRRSKADRAEQPAGGDDVLDRSKRYATFPARA